MPGYGAVIHPLLQTSQKQTVTCNQACKTTPLNNIFDEGFIQLCTFIFVPKLFVTKEHSSVSRLGHSRLKTYAPLRQPGRRGQLQLALLLQIPFSAQTKFSVHALINMLARLTHLSGGLNAVVSSNTLCSGGSTAALARSASSWLWLFRPSATGGSVSVIGSSANGSAAGPAAAAGARCSCSSEGKREPPPGLPPKSSEPAEDYSGRGRT